MPASAMVPTMDAQVRKALQAARKLAGRLAELVPDSTQAGITPATHTTDATTTDGCCDGMALASQPSKGMPTRIHQMPAEWTRNRIKDMEPSI